MQGASHGGEQETFAGQGKVHDDSSPLGVYDFIKRSSMIEVSEAGAQTLGAVASTLAHGEGLQAHARAAEMRLKK